MVNIHHMVRRFGYAGSSIRPGKRKKNNIPYMPKCDICRDTGKVYGIYGMVIDCPNCKK